LGSFTPVKWESRWLKWKADDSQKSFRFTLKNPNNIPARRFALKTKMKYQAIYCCRFVGRPTPRAPRFDKGSHFGDVWFHNNGNANTSSGSHLGSSYTNDTGLDGPIVFMSMNTFQVREIEVFAITD
jgi:hypothetical protein